MFPPIEILEGRYPYLQKHKLLLPIAWGQRIVTYGKEQTERNDGNKIVESLKIGKERIALMRKYGIIR